MELNLESRTALILGTGDGLDGAITRELANHGMATLTATHPDAVMDMAQPGDTLMPHWTNSEDDIDEVVVQRLNKFLESQDRSPDAVIACIDVEASSTGFARQRVPWLNRRKSLTTVMLALLRTVLAAVPNQGNCSVVLVFRMQDDIEDIDVYQWLERVMLEITFRARDQGLTGVRVNAILVGARDTYPEAAYAVAFLCSHKSALISGAFIPVDDGEILARSM